MSNYQVANTANLFDFNTNEFVGVVGPDGKEKLISPGTSTTLGPVADVSTLNSTYPAASNALRSAYVTGVGWFDCDGVTWVPRNSGDTASAYANCAGLPIYDVGDTARYKNGIPIRKLTNGEQFRYVVEPGFAIFPESLNDAMCSDAVTTLQPLGVFTIPGGSLLHNDRGRIAFTLQCADASGAAVAFGSTSCKAYIRLIGLGQASSSATFTQAATSTSVTSILVDSLVMAFVSNVLRFQSASLTPGSDTQSKRINLLSDFQIEVGYIHSGTATGRFITLDQYSSDRARFEFYPAMRNYQASSAVVSPINRPFRIDSLFNVPLPPSATYAGPTDPITAAVIGGDNYGGLSGSTFCFIQGINTNPLTPYQMSDSDPWTLVTYTRRQANGAPWPFAWAVQNNFAADQVYMKLPRQQLPQSQAGDNVVLLVTPDKRFYLECGGMTWNAALQRHECGAIACIDLLGSGITTRNINPLSSTNIDSGLSQFQETYRATGLPFLGGAVRGWDLANGAIEHVVGLQLSVSQHMASVFKVVTQTGTTFEVVPVNDTSYTQLDYSSLFKAGAVVYHGGSTYTIAADATWSSGTNRTTFTVETTISTSSTTLALGGTTQSAKQARQFVWPSTTCDSGSVSQGNATFYNGIIPLGTFFAIPPAVDLNSLGLTAGGLMLARALQKYGGVDNDSTVGTFGLCQLDYDASTNYRDLVLGMSTDRQTIRAQLRRVTNYDRNLVRAGLLDKTATRPSRVKSIY